MASLTISKVYPVKEEAKAIFAPNYPTPGKSFVFYIDHAPDKAEQIITSEVKALYHSSKSSYWLVTKNSVYKVEALSNEDQDKTPNQSTYGGWLYRILQRPSK